MYFNRQNFMCKVTANHESVTTHTYTKIKYIYYHVIPRTKHRVKVDCHTRFLKSEKEKIRFITYRT